MAGKFHPYAPSTNEEEKQLRFDLPAAFTFS
jgi:hypothetical protein